MTQPVAAAAIAELLSLSEASRISDVLKIARSMGSFDVVDLAPPVHKSLAAAMLDTYAQLGVPLSRSERTLVLSEVGKLPFHVQLAAGALLSTINFCDLQVRLAWKEVSAEDHAWFVETSMNDAQLTPADERRNQIVERVDMARVVACSILLADTIEQQIPRLKANSKWISPEDPNYLEPPRLAFERTEQSPPNVTQLVDDLIAQPCWDNGPGTPPWGENLPEKLVRIGHEGDNCYAPGGTILTLDLGGADRYANGAGSAVFPVLGTFARISLSIDLAQGNDVYSTSQAVGASGIGMLYDEAGNETYNGGTGQVRAGGGVAILRDRHGNDTFQCSSGCQGYAGSQAVAILMDRAGNDIYRNTVGNGQAVATQQGTAILFDADGDDYYVSPTGSQGFVSNGGGTAILIDRRGSDRYDLTTTSFGRGSTPVLPNGLAFFFDLGGADLYNSGPGFNDGYWGPGQSIAVGANPRATYARGHDCEDENACLEQIQSLLPGT